MTPCKHALFALLFLVVLGCHPAAQRSDDPRPDLSRHPELWKVLGKSVSGEPIYYHEHGNGDDVVLVLGCTHGDEQVTGQVVIRLAESIATHNADSIKRKILFVPILNPDGVAQGTRTNAHGVDINRNFPTMNWTAKPTQDRYPPGPSPASEPETQLVLDLLSRYSPRLIITLHASLHMVNYDGPAKEIAERLAGRNGYRVSGDIGYPTPGSLGTYAGVERNIPVITLELPPVSADDAWEQNREALMDILTY